MLELLCIIVICLYGPMVVLMLNKALSDAKFASEEREKKRNKRKKQSKARRKAIRNKGR